MPSFREEDHDKKITDFYKKVAHIEKKHLTVFEVQISELTGQYPYILVNYFFIQWYADKYELIFSVEVYIPPRVKEEITHAFAEIFLSKKPQHTHYKLQKAENVI